jgi:hypothetical protein
MSEASLKITERDGWGKVFPLDKSVIKIGSGPYCDVQLTSADIAPLHLQVFYSTELPTSCRVVNLASPVEYRHRTETERIDSLTTTDLHNGCRIRLGDYTIGFSLPLSGEVEEQPRSIAANLHFSSQVLRPGAPIEGLLTVKNLGSEKTCQFQVALSGLPSDCYLIDPIPLIYPSAQEEVRVQLFHKTTYPPAGRTQILLTVTAPVSYPGEVLVIEQEIDIAPVFDLQLEVFDDLHPLEKSPAEDSGLPAAEVKPTEALAPLPEEPAIAAAAPEAAPSDGAPSDSVASYAGPVSFPNPAAPVAASPAVAPLPVASAASPATFEPESALSTTAAVSEAPIEPAPVRETPLWSVPVGFDSEPEPEQLDPKPDGQVVPPVPASVQEEPEPAGVPANGTPAQPVTVEANAPISVTPPAAPVPPPAPKRDLSGLKVVRDQSNDFWDNE